MAGKTKFDELIDQIAYKTKIDSWRGILFVQLPAKAIRECSWCYSGMNVEVTMKPTKKGKTDVAKNL